ncbi:PorV/PorQ family protein [candidate division WOR-3 bacterium]|nr:PorV/PorQ family protein [candidate division WOR-3 bacterium]
MLKSLKRSSRKRNRSAGFVTGALILTLSALCGALKASQGYASLKIAACAREAGMGEAGVAGASSASAMRWNPSLLVGGPGLEVSVHHSRWFLGTSQSALLLKRQYGRLAVGAEILYFNGGEIELRDSISSPEPIGTYDFADLSFGLGMAVEIVQGTRIGLTGRYYYERLQSFYGSSWGLDAGFIYTPLPGFQLGFSVLDFGFDMHLDGMGFKPPMTLRVGGAYSREWNETIATALNIDFLYRPFESEPGVRTGVEVSLFRLLSLRAGVKLLSSNEDDEIELISPSEFLAFGLGIKQKTISLDYALVPYSGLNLGLTHRISLNLEFD